MLLGGSRGSLLRRPFGGRRVVLDEKWRERRQCLGTSETPPHDPPVGPPAFAIDGRTAVGLCIDSNASGKRCAWAVNDKGEIDICTAHGCVELCTMQTRSRSLIASQNG